MGCISAESQSELITLSKEKSNENDESTSSAENIDSMVKSLECVVDQIDASVISSRDSNKTENGESSESGLKITNPTTCDWSNPGKEGEANGHVASRIGSSEIIISSDSEFDTDDDIQESIRQKGEKEISQEKKSHEEDRSDAKKCDKNKNSGTKKLIKRLQCDNCKKRFAHVKRYQIHKCKINQCNKCDFNSVHKLELKEHKMSQHKKSKADSKTETVKINKIKVRVDSIPVSSKGKSTCYKCGKVYLTNRKVRDHLNSECGKEPSLECSHCGTKFYEERRLKKHVFHRHFNAHVLEVSSRNATVPN